MPTLASSPILFFDSGIGGLSVLGEVRAILPDAPVIYAADNAGLPYGNKSEAEIAARVCGLLGRMSERFRPRLICIACNTASTIALAMVRDVLRVPIVGTVPAIKPAALASKSGVIGVLGTEATMRQPYIDRLEQEFVQGKTMLRHAAPQLVSAAEAKLAGSPVDHTDITAALNGLIAQEGGSKIDQIVLGCTHFPLLRNELENSAGILGLSENLQFIDSGAGIARRIVYLSQGQQFERSEPDKALFTGDMPGTSLQQSLREFSLTEIDNF